MVGGEPTPEAGEQMHWTAHPAALPSQAKISLHLVITQQRGMRREQGKMLLLLLLLLPRGVELT